MAVRCYHDTIVFFPNYYRYAISMSSQFLSHVMEHLMKKGILPLLPEQTPQI